MKNGGKWRYGDKKVDSYYYTIPIYEFLSIPSVSFNRDMERSLKLEI